MNKLTKKELLDLILYKFQSNSKKIKHEEPKSKKLILPKPTPIKETFPKIVNTLETDIERFKKIGEEKKTVIYNGGTILQVIAYIALIIKYEKKCAMITKDLDNYEIGDKYKSSINKKFFDNAELLANDLLDCIERDDKIIAIPITLKFGKSKDAHANLLIYRPLEKTIERFEPHGQQVFTQNTEHDNLIFNKVLKEMFEVKMKKYLGKYTPKYVLPEEICPILHGFQSIESQVAKLKQEGGGFCGMWYLFILEMIFLNPTKSTSEIINEALEISKKDKNYLASVIRGYVVEIELLLKDYIKKIDSTSNFTFNNPELIIYNNKYKLKMELLKLLISFDKNKKNSQIKGLEKDLYNEEQLKKLLKNKNKEYINEMTKKLFNTQFKKNTIKDQMIDIILHEMKTNAYYNLSRIENYVQKNI